MIVITGKEKNSVFGFGNTVEYLPNGYPYIREKNIGFALTDINLYEDVPSVPKEVIPGKYCYTPESGFYIDPDWVEPVNNPYPGIDTALVEQIKADYREQLAKEVSVNGYNA